MPQRQSSKSNKGNGFATLAAKMDAVSDSYYSDIAKVSAGLFIGVLALMTFLLSVGLQHPHVDFRVFFYVSVISLALNLLLYAKGSVLKSLWGANGKWLAVVRLLNQLSFIVSVVAVAGFAITAAQIFFDVQSSTGAFLSRALHIG